MQIFISLAEMNKAYEAYTFYWTQSAAAESYPGTDVAKAQHPRDVLLT